MVAFLSVLGGCLLIAGTFAVVWGLVALVIMFGWNLFAPVFEWPVLEYGHAFGITVLLSIVSGFFRRVVTTSKS